MVHRMDIYCLGKDAKHKFANLPRLSARAHAYTAWGVFNYYTYVLGCTYIYVQQLMKVTCSIRSLYYRTHAPTQAPACPIPGEDWRFPEAPSMFLGTTFGNWCRLWALMLELAIIYCQDSNAPSFEECTLSFAERKYREILDWSKGLSAPTQYHKGALYNHIVFR